MLFFRSEERVREWCESHELPARPLITLEQLWDLSVAWYSNRLSPDARSPGPEEMRQIFSRIGLAGDFWDPRSDHF